MTGRLNPTAAEQHSLRRVLMLAYVFPPFYSVGGSIRVVKFIKYLCALGWLPTVLTVDDSRDLASQQREGSATLCSEIPPTVAIYRTNAGEPSRALLETGRTLRRRSRLAATVVNTLRVLRRFAQAYLLLPDENLSWLPFAVRMGRQIIRRHEIDLIFVTCPPHSAALSGVLLKWWTGRPLVLDFRDDWIDTPWYRRKPWLSRQLERWLERWVVHRADRVIAVTAWSHRTFLARYPHEPSTKFALIPNGCDLADFAPTEQAEPKTAEQRFTIVHSGLLTESADWQRSPRPLFAALAQLRRTHPKKAARLQLIFTGTLPEATRAAMVQLGIGDLIQEVGHLPQAAYHRLLRQADLLLAINYTGFTTLIPGKLYEYWAVGAAPILLLDSGGAASELVAHHQLGTAVPPAAVEQIYAALLMYYQQWAAGKPLQIRREGIAAYDRKVLTRQLAALFNAVVQPSRSGRITATTAHDHNHWSSDERRSNYHQRRLPHA